MLMLMFKTSVFNETCSLTGFKRTLFTLVCYSFTLCITGISRLAIPPAWISVWQRKTGIPRDQCVFSRDKSKTRTMLLILGKILRYHPSQYNFDDLIDLVVNCSPVVDCELI